MRRFPSGALLSTQAKHGIASDLAARLAHMVARSHEVAPVSPVSGAGVMAGLGVQLSAAFTDSPDIFRAPETLEFHALYEAALARNRPLLNRRSGDGLVRRCHGDMHCGNIIVEDGTPKLFDAIEFSEKIATVDVLYDLAFLLMDLWNRNEAGAANTVLNRYLQLRRREEDLSGLALLPLFLATRAGVRALVAADLAHERPPGNAVRERGQALDGFRLSIAFLKPPPPVLVCVGGLSGTGKSTLAASLACSVGAAPGALLVRSDVERKVLAGVAETERLPLENYSARAASAVYDACLARAGAALSAGHSVILDAVFARRSERTAAEALARRCAADFLGLWLTAPPEVLRARVAARHGDASDATPEVVDRQLGYDTGAMDWRLVDASGAPGDTLRLAIEMLPSRSAGRA